MISVWAATWLGLLLYLPYNVHGACTTTTVSDYAPASGGEEDSSAASESDCEEACQYDPTCHAYTWESSTCTLHTPKTAYRVEDASGATHGYMENCDMWNYAGWSEGCGSTKVDDMACTNGKEMTASNEHSCWYQCLEWPRCMAWDWDGSACYLCSDKGLETLEAAAGTTHHPILCPELPFAYFLSGWHYYPMMRVAGAKLQSGEMSFEDCQAACDADSTCTAVDWDVDKTHCFFHTSDNKDTSCENPLIWSKNTYHMKKTACTTTPDYPAAFFEI